MEEHHIREKNYIAKITEKDEKILVLQRELSLLQKSDEGFQNMQKEPRQETEKSSGLNVIQIGKAELDELNSRLNDLTLENQGLKADLQNSKASLFEKKHSEENLAHENTDLKCRVDKLNHELTFLVDNSHSKNFKQGLVQETLKILLNKSESLKESLYEKGVLLEKEVGGLESEIAERREMARKHSMEQAAQISELEIQIAELLVATIK